MSRERLLALADAVDDLVGNLAREVTDYPALPTFRDDMVEALSGDPLVPFTVEDVLDAMHNWSLITVRRHNLFQDETQGKEK